jgi:hypothetical protein
MDDHYRALAKRTSAEKAFAARNLFGTEFKRQFVEKTGYVQCRGGKSPQFRRLDVKVDVKGQRVVIHATIAEYSSIHSQWASLGKSASMKRVLEPEESFFVERLAELAAKVPAGSPPVIPKSAGIGVHPFLLACLAVLVLLPLMAILFSR